MSSRHVVAVFGPTGIGKTAVAVALARRLRGRGEEPVAVSADALQIYAGLGRLTGAPSHAEAAELAHRLVGEVPVNESFSAGAYARRAHAAIDELLAAGRRVIVVGGTGLYLRAALAELDLRPPPEPAVRAFWRAQLERRGTRALHAELAARRPLVAAGVAPTDSQRLIRQLELSDAGLAAPPAPGEASQLWTSDTRHPTLLAGLVMDRTALRARIDARVEAMVAAGAADEVRAADRAGASPGARQALGFRELLSGDVEGMKVRTRRYAKRQLTWMRKLPGVLLLDATGREADDLAGELEAALRRAENGSRDDAEPRDEEH